MANVVKNVLKAIKGSASIGFSLLLLLLFCSTPACNKYTDPKGPDLSDKLTNPYCNDPRAVNYNHGFPGKPNDSVCIYPIDSFIGSWTWHDSVYTTEFEFLRTEQYEISFTALEDTLFSHIKMSGWCAQEFYLTADKFQRAFVDTLLEGGIGQLGCTPTDTVSGFLNKNTGMAETLQFQLSVTTAEGTLLHLGTATKLN